MSSVGTSFSTSVNVNYQVIFVNVQRGLAWPGAWRARRLPGRWPDGGLSEGYGHDGPGICLGDGQTEAYLKDMDMAGLVSAWAMARRRPI